MRAGLRRLCFVAGVLFVGGGGGCGHAHQVGDVSATPSEKKAPPAPTATAEKKSPHPRAIPSTGRDERPLAMAPAGLLSSGAAADIQEKLIAKGQLDRDHASGRLDEPTREALRKFQGESGLPATGIPDDATISKLGLKPKDVFRAAENRKDREEPEGKPEGKPEAKATTSKER
jgi:peptidoglycan hydrolase-like protein with peptidoglycan-binding domain